MYGDQNLTEQRMQQALAQFIRSIQSFDSKYDKGRASVADDQAAFSNFTAEENRGKTLFLAPPGMGGPIGDGMMNGGLGCNACHSAPEFDIDPRSRNNGVITSASNPAMLDLNNTRSPSLRDLFNPMGELNGPMMHNGAFENINEVLDHYTNIPNNNNNNLDPRLGRGPGQRQNLSNDDRNALIAFLQTLSGQDMYTNEKWSDPF
jgi:cytochrome c peroxidase